MCCAFTIAALSPNTSQAEPAREFSLKGGYFGPVLSLAKFKQRYKPAVGTSRQISGTGKLIGAIIGYELSPKKMLLAVEGDVGFADQSNRHIAYSASFKTRVGIRKPFGTPYLIVGYTLAGVRDPSSIAPKRLLHGIQLGAGYEQRVSHAFSGRLDYAFSHFFNSGRSSRQRSHALRAALIFHITR